MPRQLLQEFIVLKWDKTRHHEPSEKVLLKIMFNFNNLWGNYIKIGVYFKEKLLKKLCARLSFFFKFCFAVFETLLQFHWRIQRTLKHNIGNISKIKNVMKNLRYCSALWCNEVKNNCKMLSPREKLASFMQVIPNQIKYLKYYT